MLFRNLPPRALERLGSMVVDIQVSLLHWRSTHFIILFNIETQFNILHNRHIKNRILPVTSR